MTARQPGKGGPAVSTIREELGSGDRKAVLFWQEKAFAVISILQPLSILLFGLEQTQPAASSAQPSLIWLEDNALHLPLPG